MHLGTLRAPPAEDWGFVNVKSAFLLYLFSIMGWTEQSYMYRLLHQTPVTFHLFCFLHYLGCPKQIESPIDAFDL